ncbi:DUF3549 family protein [Aliiglaciecola litoralis]|uniref:DUF3549 family protein n=1 Tax=Aliiglaciecola litoralis TaxID=582857 RepID=A0ABN1LH55_9ALTE
MTQNQISTISEFLLHAGTDYRVFDMGRGIRALDTQQFLDWELTKDLPAFPRAGHAWFGIVFWDKTRSDQQYIWFVKLPLDEQGQIVTAARNHYLQIIVDALGSQLQNAEQKNGQLPDNPYSFVPNQHQLADFNSISRLTLQLGNSQFFAPAKNYIRTPMVIDWQTIALQGLADVVANIQSDDIAEVIAKQFEHYPQTVQHALLTSMENTVVPDVIMQSISHWLLARPDNAQDWQHGLRAMSQVATHPYSIELTSNALQLALSSQPNTLAVISGRLWSALLESNAQGQQLLHPFLEKVAQVDSSFQFFQAVFSDLVRIPSMREAMLAQLRSTDKSQGLTQAVGSLFSQPQNQAAKSE